MSIVFYRDSSETFECGIKIEGTSYSKIKTRLILEFSDQTLMFPGVVKEGRVNIEVPSLSQIDDKTGNAILEVIADSTYFEAWNSKFDIKTKKAISISEVKIGSEKPSIVVENITSGPEPKAIVRSTKKSIFKETCSPKNKTLVEKFFKNFKKLNESEARTQKKELKKFKPSKSIQRWADAVFLDPKTSYAKFAMKQLSEI